jgi:serine protease AprX
MSIPPHKSPGFKRFGNHITLSVLLTLVFTLLGFAPATSTALAGSRVQAALLAAASKHPNTRYGVIVQKSSRSASVEARVADLGGKVTKDLSIINGFAADMPGKAIEALGKDSDVRWISTDGPMHESSGPTMFTTWATDFGNMPTTTRAATFNSTTIRAGKYIWFSSVIDPDDSHGAATKFFADKSNITFTANGSTYSIDVPSAVVTYDPAVTTGTSTYDAVNDTWVTNLPASYNNNSFLTGVAFNVPVDLPGGISSVTWTVRISSDTPNLGANWQWAAAVYNTMPASMSGLQIKPVDSNSGNPYNNSDKAGTPENYKSSVTAGATGGGGNDYVGNYSSQNATVTPVFKNAPNMIDSATGPDATYGYGSASRASFTGFSAEKTLGNSITRVEVALVAYVPAILNPSDDPVLSVSVNGTAGTSVTLNHHTFDAFVGQSNTSTFFVDVTNTRTWSWADFDGDLQVSLDQTGFNTADNIYYDAVGLRVTSDTGTDSTGGQPATDLPRGAIATGNLLNTYNYAVRAPQVWNEAPTLLQGQGLSVAVVDSGVYKTKDISKRLIANANFNSGAHSFADGYGHGTFVAGLIAGDGSYSNGSYIGIAPKTNIVNVRVSDDQGMSIESDVVSGLQWILNNKTRYNIRVVNMSLNSSTPQSYHTSALDAACEVLWFNGVVVVVSAGNNALGGSPVLLPPANDPFVITVGATNDLNTASIMDDMIAPFSSYGVDENGGAKPDLVAPGAHLVSLLPRHQNLTLSQQHSSNRVNTNYFRMSGTSMSAPIVAGAAALLLQDEPNLTPDQVKYRLKSTAVHSTTAWSWYDAAKAGAGYLDIYAAVHGSTTMSSNMGQPASRLLWTGNNPVTWGSVNWNSVNWNSVNWNSVNWNSVNWNSVNWNSDDWTTP